MWACRMLLHTFAFILLLQSAVKSSIQAINKSPCLKEEVVLWVMILFLFTLLIFVSSELVLDPLSSILFADKEAFILTASSICLCSHNDGCHHAKNIRFANDCPIICMVICAPWYFRLLSLWPAVGCFGFAMQHLCNNYSSNHIRVVMGTEIPGFPFSS